jgi:hypothetical protein
MAFSLSMAVFLFACPVGSAGDDKPKPLPGVTLTLALVEAKSEKEPLFRCVLKNASDKPLELADGYDGKSVRLRGKGEGHRSELQLYPPSPKKLPIVVVKAGEERVVFELPVNEILFDFHASDKQRKDRQKRWRWDWPLRLAPPLTPFHIKAGKRADTDRRSVHLLRRADFWAEVEVGGRRIASKPVPLKLRLGVVPAGQDKSSLQDAAPGTSSGVDAGVKEGIK